MKKIKYGLLGILLGEFLVLFLDDKTFQDKVKKTQGFNKLLVIGEKLFNFNKQLVSKASDISYQKEYVKLSGELKAGFEKISHYFAQGRGNKTNKK